VEKKAMATGLKELTLAETRCADFLCSLTDLGQSYTVLDAPEHLKGVGMPGYTLGQLFDRLADPGESAPCRDRARLLAESQELLAPLLPAGYVLQESTVLGEALAEA
jgi:hypothetical protein